MPAPIRKLRRPSAVKPILILALTAILLTAAAVFIRTYRSFPISDKEHIMNRRDAGLTLYDRNGTPFYSFERPTLRQTIALNQVPNHVRQSLIAAEDKKFYDHLGFSPRGILRSAYLNYRDRTLTYGGSTITQQLVKNSFFTPRKSIVRKYQEVILAIKLERHYSKDDILEMYMNSAYFGEGAVGIEAAAQVYFNKSSAELTIAEGAMLIGLLPAPSQLSPLSGDPSASQQRQQYVLDRMREEQYLPDNEYRAALSENLVFTQPAAGLNQHGLHFALMVRDLLFRKYGEAQVIHSHLHVTTTLDLELQKFAEQLTSDHVASLANEQATNGAAVVIDPPTGEIRALVGSRGWGYEKFGAVNMTTQTRQAGSAFKPLVYAAALSQRAITPSSVIMDQPKTYAGNYRPRNYDGRFRGPVLTRYALANSLNVPAVEIASQIGPRQVVTVAEDLGISTLPAEAKDHLSIALGSEPVTLLELTSAYATLANNGQSMATRAILSMRDKYHREIPYPAAKPRQAIDPRIAFIISSILSDNRARSSVFGQSLTVPNYTVAVKTGTTQDYRDAWTIGYTPNLAVGAWIGNNDNSPMTKLPGALGAAPLWKTLVQRELDRQPPPPFTEPNGLVAVQVCYSSGLRLPEGSSDGYTEYFLPGTEPVQTCAPPPSPSPSPTANPEETAPPEQPKEKPAPKPSLKPKPENDKSENE